MPKILLILLLLSSSILSAQTISFNGSGPSGTNQWNNPDNWNRPRIPNADDIVEIGNQNTVVLSGDNATIKGLIISGRATLTIDDPNLRLDIIDSPAEGIRMFLRGNLVINQGTVSIRNSVGDGIYMENLSTFINRDTVYVSSFGDDGVHLQTNSSIDNSGAIAIDQLNGTNALYGINGVDGTIENQAGGNIVVTTCQNSTTTALQLAPGVLLEDSGEMLVYKLNCN